jgi:glycosyltransferase involved in cell wall biosynthesis
MIDPMMADRRVTEVSIIVPVHNEQECCAELVQRVHAVLDGKVSFEIIFIDDCSDDATLFEIEKLMSVHPYLRCVSFSRNWGHQAALLAGLRHASGKFVISMDGDLQHPPEMLPAVLEKLQGGWDVVNCARRESGAQRGLKGALSIGFYKFFNRLSSVKILPSGSDFRGMNRKSLDNLLSLPETGLFFRGMVPLIGFRQFVMEYDCQPRFGGSASYTLKKSIRLASDGLTSFSTVPLKLPLIAGVVALVIAFLYLVFSLIAVMLGRAHLAAGWLSIVCLQLMMFGVQFVFMGVFGVYIGKIFHEVKRRPSYVINTKIGFD